MSEEMTLHIEMPSPSGEELKIARLKTGLSQVDAAAMMGYPVQTGSRGGLQSRTWQAWRARVIRVICQVPPLSCSNC